MKTFLIFSRFAFTVTSAVQKMCKTSRQSDDRDFFVENFDKHICEGRMTEHV